MLAHLGNLHAFLARRLFVRRFFFTLDNRADDLIDGSFRARTTNENGKVEIWTTRDNNGGLDRWCSELFLTNGGKDDLFCTKDSIILFPWGLLVESQVVNNVVCLFARWWGEIRFVVVHVLSTYVHSLQKEEDTG